MDDLVNVMRTVSLADPALDMTPTELKLYAEKRPQDMSGLRFKPGAKPRVYHLRMLTVDEALTVDEQVSLQKRDAVAFRFGVFRIENLEGDGMTLEPAATGVDALERRTTSWSARELEKIHAAVGRAAIYEIGLLVRHREDFRGKGSSGLEPWPLSPLAMHVAAQTARPPAAANQ